MFEQQLEEEYEHIVLTSIQQAIGIIHGLTKNVYERLMQTQDNLKKITELSNQWNNIPMYTREKNSKFITFGDQLSEVKTTRCEEVRVASMEIHRLLNEDLLLFFNIPLVDPDRGKIIFK